MDRMVLNEDELMKFGESLARGLGPNAVVALSGGLGAGKTTLAKAIAAGLGAVGPVTSPTFTIIHEYGGGRLPIFHIDVYRLEGPDIYGELDELGWEEYFYGGGVCIVEWADMIPEIIPEDAVRVHMAQTGFPDLREVTLGGDASPSV